MNAMNDPSAVGAGSTNGHRYLEAAVRTASPARLRLMLMERAVEVARGLAARWREGADLGSNESSLKLLDLLTELLRGVTAGNTDQERQVCGQVADLYVFLTQHLLRAEEVSDADAVDEIRIVLETEAETWRSVCAQELARQTPDSRSPQVPAGGINLQG